ncbi:sigma-54 dependent transcriptional regulator, TPR domain [Stanieria sp. NIES-3757]|nr:sigma-54 dependent transcriptional regulator, TPR domain [Stanieria sp. NIES-3757]
MSNPKILVVDDDKIIRLTVAQCLEPQGYEVATASNGKEALQQIQEQPFDLILLDLKMAGMKGLEVLKQAHEIAPATKIVVFSGHSSIEEAVKAMKLGAVDFIQKPMGYIQKPFNPTQLRELVTNVLNDRSLKK